MPPIALPTNYPIEREPMPFMNTQIDIGIIQHGGDSRNILAAITESVDKTFQACKQANPRGFMDQADALDNCRRY